MLHRADDTDVLDPSSESRRPTSATGGEFLDIDAHRNSAVAHTHLLSFKVDDVIAEGPAIAVVLRVAGD